MSSEHTISIATASADGARDDGRVPMPVDELMASNGLVTGQSGAEPDESVRRLARSLLDAGQTVFVVDPAGDFDGLTDHTAVLHVGGDRNCDVQVDPGAVDRVASLALEGSTSIVLDLTSFDAASAGDVLGKLTDDLVDSRHERRADLLLVVNECHRWLAESGPATRTGENLVRLGGRGHDGVGIVGITDQPADIREDVRSGVDWVLAHRLTWQEDVRALDGMLDRHHVDALETLADEEAIYNAGWEGAARRVSIGPDATRNATVATSTATANQQDDLFAGLPEARSPDADGNAARDQQSKDADGEVAALRDELADMENRVAALEAKLDARESIEDVADRIADAITEGLRDAGVQPNAASAEGSTAGTSESRTASKQTADDGSNDGLQNGATTQDDADPDDAGGFGDVFGMFDDDGNQDSTVDANASPSGRTDDTPADSGAASADSEPQSPADSSPTRGANGGAATDESSAQSSNGADGGGMSFEPIDFGFEESGADVDSTVPDDFGPPSRHGSSGRTIPRYLRKVVRSLEEMDATTRRMLAYYIEQGTDSPMDAHYAAGGGGDRTRAYAHNRRLRTNGLIEHVGKGKYAPRLREYVIDEAGHSVPEHELDRAVDVIRQTVEEA